MAMAIELGQGPKVLDVFLEPTCPHCTRAFHKLKPLLEAAGADRLTIRVFMHSQPWHLFSPVICRAILAAASKDGTQAAWDVMTAVFDNREAFIATDHATGENMNASQVDMLARMRDLSGVDVAGVFESKEVMTTFKWHTKFARQNGIHVSPTFMVDGLINDGMGSRDEIEKWLADIGLAET